MVALFENGVTVAMAGWEYAASCSFSSHPAVTSVSLLRRTASRPERPIPRLTLPTNPRRAGLRRTSASLPAPLASAASTSGSCGPSITSTSRWRSRSVWRARLSRHAASSAAAP